MEDTWVQSLGWKDLLKEEMKTHSSILAWQIPWPEKPGGLEFMGLQRVGQELATKQQQVKLKFMDAFLYPISSAMRTVLRFKLNIWKLLH